MLGGNNWLTGRFISITHIHMDIYVFINSEYYNRYISSDVLFKEPQSQTKTNSASRASCCIPTIKWERVITF